VSPTCCGLRPCAPTPSNSVEEASLLQAEASERARVHGERQGAVEERNGALARREADLREARTQVTHLAEELASLDLRCQEVALRLGSLEEQIRERYPDVRRLADVLADFHLRSLAGEKEETGSRSCAACSNAWATST
jgi:uncharacterized protein (DUF3084 family)